MRADEYICDVEIVDVDDWEGERTAPGPVKSTAELMAERDALVLVKQWLDAEVANDAEG